MNIGYWIKYLIFLVTPHLLFDKIAYRKAKVNSNLLETLRKHDNVYIFLACDYSNLGDFAITKAQTEMLRILYPKHIVHVFGYDETYSALKTVVRCHKTTDIVTIIGGGNMGELYYGFERKRNFIVEKLTEYKIISFPQSIAFKNTAFGRIAFKRAVGSYKKHPRLIMLFREKMSYQRILNACPMLNCYLVPDIVMTLNCRTDSKRNGIIMSLRNDKECFLTNEQKNTIRNLVVKKDKHALEIDTCTVSDDNLEVSYQNLIKHYQNAEMIITDRLHGMIFAYITGTPAIILPNNNGKIEYSFDWIKDCGYIFFVKSTESFPKIFQEISNQGFLENVKDLSDSMRRNFDFLRETVI